MTVRTTQWRPVGTPAASIISLANSFEPSSRAASRTGPKHGTAAARSESVSPATSGASGPTTTRSTPASIAAPVTESGSPTSASSASASARIPALPGTHSSSGRCGERASARISACSRPPPPTTRTRMGSGRAQSDAMKSSIGIAASDS